MLSVDDIRERIAAQIEGVLGAEATGPFRRARNLTPSTFPGAPTPEARDIAHHAFLVWIPSTTLDGRDRSGQPRARGVVGSHVVTVQWAHRLRVDGADADLAVALGVEARLVDAIADTRENPGLRPRVTGIDRSTTSDGLLFVGTVTVAVPTQPTNPQQVT